MSTKTTVTSARILLGAATLVCTLAAGTLAAAGEPTFPVSVHLSTRGLDLSQPADAKIFYQRIKHAADVVCTHGNRVRLEPVESFNRCYETAIADAVRSVKAPRLTEVYLATHTLEDAAAHAIDVPALVAAK